MKRITIPVFVLLCAFGIVQCDALCDDPDQAQNLCDYERYDWDSELRLYTLTDFRIVTCSSLGRPEYTVAAECSDDIALLECYTKEERYRDGDLVSSSVTTTC